MPTFCRHNRFKHTCPVCTKEAAARERRAAPAAKGRSASGSAAARRPRAMVVRQAVRSADDGYRSPLVPGIKSREDAERLAGALAASAARLEELEADAPGLFAEVGAEPDLEEATWLAFLIAYLGPLEGEDPFAGVRGVRTSWASGGLPDLNGVPLGPRSAHDRARGTVTLVAYRAWAERAGSQAAAFRGDAPWTPDRRFARVFERLALPGFHRDARFELLVALGRLGRYDMTAGSLQLGGGDPTTVAAKRVFGIGDTLLLERRAAELAETAEVPLDVLDHALFSWGGGGSPATTAHPREGIVEALGL